MGIELFWKEVNNGRSRGKNDCVSIRDRHEKLLNDRERLKVDGRSNLLIVGVKEEQT